MVVQQLQRTRIGHIQVTRIHEDELRASPGFPDGVTIETFDRYRDSIPPSWHDGTGVPMLAMSGFVLSDGETNILVDTCNGEWAVAGFPAPRASPFLEQLRLAGYAPEDIHVVVNTHLHFDHVGCNTHAGPDGAPVATFPNAEYLFAREEWESATEHAAHGHVVFGRVDRAVTPLLDSGRGRLVERDHRITDAVSLVPTPGHTAGHVSVGIITDGGEGLVTGDMAHHPIQLFEPDLLALFEEDSAEAARTRARLVERLVQRDSLVLGTHFAGTGVGRMERVPGGFRYIEVC